MLCDKAMAKKQVYCKEVPTFQGWWLDKIVIVDETVILDFSIFT